MSSNKVDVIFIAGEGRSGSTLFERVLGQHEAIFATGELMHIWERSFIENQLCGCNKPFKECVVWTKIVEKFRQKIGEISPESVIESFKKTARIRHFIPFKRFNREAVEYIGNVYYNLYSSIREITGKQYIIDSSKHPVYGHILAQNPNINLYVIHIVRNSKGVAYSWTKKKIRPEIIGRVEYMPRYPVVRTAISWLVVNKISEELSKYPNVKYYKIVYEDFITKSKKILEEVYKFLEIENNVEALFKNSKTLMLKTNHLVAGNPMRFKVGEIILKLDEEWKEKMPMWQKWIIDLITKPCKKYFNKLNI